MESKRFQLDDQPARFAYVSQEFASILYNDWTNLDDGDMCAPKAFCDRIILAYEPLPTRGQQEIQQQILHESPLPHDLRKIIDEYLFVLPQHCLVDLLCECMIFSPHWILEMYMIVTFSNDLARVYPNGGFRYDLTETEQQEVRGMVL